MASPWKFLSRLVPRRREPKQADAEVADRKPDVLALSGPAEIVAEDSLDALSAHVDADLPPAEISDPASVETPAIESALGEADDMPANVVADVVAGDMAPSDLPDTVVIPSPDAADVQLRGETKPRRQMGQTRRPKLADTEQVPPDRSIPSNDTLSLDDEIRVLRGQLAEKLRLQNAQLRKMLERFER
ncbi:hypothetical protein [Rhizobium sp. NFR12]|uniref:hypothetical protein n=1 Tax=Rhizobium sp. NFR12 TaxID=1566261 RepID=UPI0008A768FD|nr:hypothetical protein [Rhizobium sp. NFR12]SEH30984.1 hypothetical protein SAMN03159407_4213 [Rhizobium sp. NFR12]